MPYLLGYSLALVYTILLIGVAFPALLYGIASINLTPRTILVVELLLLAVAVVVMWAAGFEYRSSLMVLSNRALFWVVVSVLGLFGFLSFGVAVVLAAAAHFRMVGRGWSPAVGGLLAYGPMLVGLVAPVLVMLTAPRWDDDASPDGDITPFLLACAIGACGLFASVLACCLTGRLQPRRRSGGLRRRRHHYGVWARVLSAASLPGAALAWRAGGWDPIRTLFTIFLPGVLWLRWLERRYETQIESVDVSAATNQVLYLRPFESDQHADVYVDDDETSWSDGVASWVNLECFLAEEMERGVGPLVALGSPWDTLPPGGGRRVYLDDSHWEEEFKRLIHEFKAVVMRPGDTIAIEWETRAIVDEGLHSRFFILTAPRRRPHHHNALNILAYRNILTYHLGRSWEGVMARINGWHTVTWSTFAARLTKCGLHPGEAPGPGAVIGFDTARRQIALAQGLSDASAIVDVIATRLLVLGDATNESALRSSAVTPAPVFTHRCSPQGEA